VERYGLLWTLIVWIPETLEPPLASSSVGYLLSVVLVVADLIVGRPLQSTGPFSPSNCLRLPSPAIFFTLHPSNKLPVCLTNVLGSIRIYAQD
jgi:hypothetical protein